jgi:hypothetical protein
MNVSMGDVLQVTIWTQNDVFATAIADLNNGGDVQVSDLSSVTPGVPGIAEISAYSPGTTNIPTFSKIKFSSCTIDGAGLTSLTALTQMDWLNTDGKPIMITGALTPSGKGFTLGFKRNGLTT